MYFSCCFIGSETWPLILRQKHSAEVVLNRAVRKMFGLNLLAPELYF